MSDEAEKKEYSVRAGCVSRWFERYLAQTYVLPPGARIDPRDLARIKDAFFAGFWGALIEVEGIAASEASPATMEKAFQSMYNECHEYATEAIARWEQKQTPQ